MLCQGVTLPKNLLLHLLLADVTTMNNVTGRGGGPWVCVQREKKKGSSSSSSSSPSFTTPFLSHSPPLSYSPNPLAAGRTAEGQREKRREAEGEAGVGYLDVHEHADRRSFGRAMTAMLSPKIRQTRRGRTRFIHMCSICQLHWL